MSATAELSSDGRGIVYRDDEVFLIEVGKMYQPEKVGLTFNLSMWMQGTGIGETVDADEYPFRAVYDHLKELYAKRREELLKLAEGR